MLPFARMVQYGNNAQTGQYVLNLDFTRQTVGDTNIIDYSTNSHTFTKLNTGQANIVLDSTLGTNVMYFNGAVFSTPMVDDLKLQSKYFEIDVVYKSFSNAIQVLYGTGYYPDVTNRIAGLCHQIKQYDGNDQYFLDDGTTYNRNLISASTESQWQRLIYSRTSGGVNIKRYRNGTLVNQISFADYPYGNGTYFGVGGYYQTPANYLFYGYMQYLKVKVF